MPPVSGLPFSIALACAQNYDGIMCDVPQQSAERARYDVTIAERARAAIACLSRFANVRAAYLFGSQVEGRADRWSDIDLAVFIEGLEAWDLHDRARIAAEVQKEAGDDIELHFFPAEMLQPHHDASFAAWVLNHGVRLAG